MSQLCSSLSSDRRRHTRRRHIALHYPIPTCIEPSVTQAPADDCVLKLKRYADISLTLVPSEANHPFVVMLTPAKAMAAVKGLGAARGCNPPSCSVSRLSHFLRVQRDRVAAVHDCVNPVGPSLHKLGARIDQGKRAGPIVDCLNSAFVQMSQ